MGAGQQYVLVWVSPATLIACRDILASVLCMLRQDFFLADGGYITAPSILMARWFP